LTLWASGWPLNVRPLVKRTQGSRGGFPWRAPGGRAAQRTSTPSSRWGVSAAFVLKRTCFVSATLLFHWKILIELPSNQSFRTSSWPPSTNATSTNNWNGEKREEKAPYWTKTTLFRAEIQPGLLKKPSFLDVEFFYSALHSAELTSTMFRKVK